jgi:hypothetical protein
VPEKDLYPQEVENTDKLARALVVCHSLYDYDYSIIFKWLSKIKKINLKPDFTCILNLCGTIFLK